VFAIVYHFKQSVAVYHLDIASVDNVSKVCN